jgi:argininosuccinate lyase
MTKSSLQWGGRFQELPDARMRRFNDSISFDIELLDEDVEGSIAWARTLASAGVLSTMEAESIARALDELRTAEASDPGEYEDVHSYVESKLRERIGDLAGKLHSGRSRNDQVATDLRLWLRKAIAEAEFLCLELALTLSSFASREASSVMPGYTHLKHAEPVTAGHWALAYVEMLERDADRLRSAWERADECPLGSGALAGTPLDIDREALAKSLGFSRATRNSIDAVADRDAAIDYLHAAAMLFVHLSRFAEDLIFYTSDECRFARLADRLSTGSSRMPQKRNPDVLELTRAHAARMIGELVSLLTLLKGLPLSYDKDLQLDKEPLFRTRRLLRDALPLLGDLIESLDVDRSRMEEAANHDLLVATQLTDRLAARGIPFREAHEIVAKRVAFAEQQRCGLADLAADDGVTKIDLANLGAATSIAQKAALGGTSPARVSVAAADAVARIRKKLDRGGSSS